MNETTESDIIMIMHRLKRLIGSSYHQKRIDIIITDNVHYVRNGNAWVSDAPKTSSHDGWSITECVRNGLCTINAGKTYQGSTGSFSNKEVKGYEPPASSGENYGTLACHVGSNVVSHGYCMVLSKKLLISFNGYGNSITLSANITYPIKHGA